MASLIVSSGKQEGDYYPLGRRTNVIGRDEALFIQILDHMVSRKHLQIRFDPDAIPAWLRSFEPGRATAVPPLTRQPHRDLDRLIEAAKREDEVKQPEPAAVAKAPEETLEPVVKAPAVPDAKPVEEAKVETATGCVSAIVCAAYAAGVSRDLPPAEATLRW